MGFSYWILKVTDIHSEYVIFIMRNKTNKCIYKYVYFFVIRH